VKKRPDAWHDSYRVGKLAFVHRGAFFSSLKEMYLQHMERTRPPTDADELEKKLFNMTESALLGEIIGSSRNSLFDGSALMNALPNGALDSVFKFEGEDSQVRSN